jgi:outer membrane lipoprotein-sorting protein
MKKILVFGIALLMSCGPAFAGFTPEVLIEKVKLKMEQVRDYAADARLKTNVAFIKAPVGTVKVYYKKPNKLRIEKEKGLSILPKGGAMLNISTLLTMKNYDAIDAGEVLVDKVKARKIRILPREADADIVVMDVFIDEQNLLLLQSTVTTKENGTFDMQMAYGKFKEYMLPDKLTFHFNVKNYKMPKSLSLDFDEQLSKQESEKLKNKKGTVEFTYSNYVINKGLSEQLFRQ